MARTRATARKCTTPKDQKQKNKDKSGWDQTKDKSQLYETIVKKNEHFEKYYRQLPNLIDENEFELFLESLKIPLPITFRITSYKSFAQDILKILKEDHFKYLDEATKGEEFNKILEESAKKTGSLLNYAIKNPSENAEALVNQEEQVYKCLSWYPNELAWQVSLSKQDVKKNTHFEKFKQFLVHQTDNGNISRQEAVSMIPPLLLDIQPHHKILDMCAAPGSKTAQLIEFLHQDKANPTPDGFVIANDLDNKRCYLLMHQLKRLESPNFMIINQDSSNLPNFRNAPDSNDHVHFDRILADVPCSGKN
jgi:tRNA (cytosine34-C5)-methyltransferase